MQPLTTQAEKGEPMFDTDHDELLRITQEHWKTCKGVVG